jgi:hypothetical protein
MVAKNKGGGCIMLCRTWNPSNVHIVEYYKVSSDLNIHIYPKYV